MLLLLLWLLLLLVEVFGEVVVDARGCLDVGDGRRDRLLGEARPAGIVRGFWSEWVMVCDPAPKIAGWIVHESMGMGLRRDAYMG